MTRLPDFSAFDLVAQPIFVLTMNSHGAVVYSFLNEAGRNNLGMSLDAVVGKSACELFPGRVGQSVMDRQTTAWRSGKPADYEIALPIPHGTYWARTMLTPVYNDDGSLKYIVGTSQDISKQVQLDQALTMAEAMASEIEDFVSFAAHDLRSPIANVKMLASLLRADFVDLGDGKLKMIDMIENICTKALTLVSEVLSQTKAAAPSDERKPFDFHAMCDDILVTLDPARQHTVKVQRARVKADYTAMHIVLRNLIDNSIKYSNQDRTQLSLSVSSGTANRIAVTVSDDGVGFSDPSSAFAGNDTDGVDSGFGLVGVRRLIHSRGGEIAIVAPKSGSGAEVRFELPGQMMTSN